MPFLVNITVQLDTEYASEAERDRHLLIELLEEYFNAFSVSQIENGSLPDGEA